MDLYHVLNRGVDKRVIFYDSQDFVRFVHYLYECNNGAPIKNTFRVLSKDAGQMCDIGCRTLKRERIVDVHAWCLMKNHFHLILSPRIDGGISKFMQKVMIGYVKYFNEKYKRSGTLFQGKTKKIPIESESHFYHILHYVHLNPLDYLDGATDWREREIDDVDGALAHLKMYKWSSYLDYSGVKNFPSVISREFFGEVFGDYNKEISRYLKSIARRATSDVTHVI